MTNTVSKPTVTEFDLITQVQTEQVQLDWIDALFTSIKRDLEDGNIYNAKKLADLGQYLAQDLSNGCCNQLDAMSKIKH